MEYTFSPLEVDSPARTRKICYFVSFVSNVKHNIFLNWRNI